MLVVGLQQHQVAGQCMLVHALPPQIILHGQVNQQHLSHGLSSVAWIQALELLQHVYTGLDNRMLEWASATAQIL